MLKEQWVRINKKSKIIDNQTNYEKIKMVGQGTFGKVYLAKNIQTQQVCAIKEVYQDPKYKNRELDIISRIQHENIISMKDYFLKVIDVKYFLNLVMDFIPTSLSQIFKQKRKDKLPIQPQIRKIITFQMFKGLYYMQLCNVCHRDIKPANILVNDRTYEVRICDFGSAKIFEKQQKNVPYICSRYYRPPELVLGSTSYGTQIDVWSFGCIMVELLTLQPIFPGDSSVEQLIQIIKILGTPPHSLIKTYEQLHATQLPLPKIKSTSWQRILKKYSPQAQLVDLISKVLTYDTQKRIKPYEALCHPYFHSLINLEQLTKKLPNLFNFSSLNNKRNKKQIEFLTKLYNPDEKGQLSLKKNDFLKQEIQDKQQTLPCSTSPVE